MCLSVTGSKTLQIFYFNKLWPISYRLYDRLYQNRSQDTTCPITPWLEYDGEMDIARNIFVNDQNHPEFNTLQSDLYDDAVPKGMAEVLGRIQTSALRSSNGRAFSDYDWTPGHYLVIVYETQLSDSVLIEPYGDYYDPKFSDIGDGTVLVYETFVDNLILRDGSSRDIATQNLNVVLNIRHDYDLDTEDITELLKFRVAMIPKVWTDDFGDAIKSNAQDIADCLNKGKA